MAVIGNAPFQGLVGGGNIIDASIEGVDLSTSAIAARLGYTPVDPGAATFTANPTISSGTASGVLYLNGSKVATSGSALTFDGTTLSSTGFINTGNTTLGNASSDTLTINSTITSNLLFTDNTYDIGASGATRPRNLYLAGSATISGNQTLTGSLTVDSTTDSTSTITGSIQTDGGLGVAKALYVGTTLNVAGNTTLGDAAGDTLTLNGTAVSTPNNLNFDSNTLFIDATNNTIGLGGTTDLQGNRLNLVKSDSATIGPVMTFKNLYQSGSTTAGQLGVISFAAWRDVSTTGSYNVAIEAVDSSYPGTYGGLRFWTKYNGSDDPQDPITTGINNLALGPENVVFNDGGSDVDFRIESDTRDFAFFLDGATGRIGLNSGAPTVDLDINGNAAVTGTGYLALQRPIIPSLVDQGTSQITFRYYSTGTTYTAGAQIQALSATAWSSTSAPTSLVFYTVPENSTTLFDRGRFDQRGDFLVGGVSLYPTANRTQICLNGTDQALFALGTGNVGRGYISSSTSLMAMEAESGLDLKLNAIGSKQIQLWTSNTHRALMDSSGRFLMGGAGTTASSYLPAGSIQIVPGGQYSSGGFGRMWVPGQQIGSPNYAGLYGIAQTYLAYYSSGWKSMGGGTASAITIDEGIFSFANSNGVAAPDTALTWNTRFWINTNGKTYINNTTGTDQLNVTYAGGSGGITVISDGSGYNPIISFVNPGSSYNFNVGSDHASYTNNFAITLKESPYTRYLSIDGATSYVGIGNAATDPAYQLDVAGSIRSRGGFIAEGALKSSSPTVNVWNNILTVNASVDQSFWAEIIFFVAENGGMSKATATLTCVIRHNGSPYNDFYGSNFAWVDIQTAAGSTYSSFQFTDEGTTNGNLKLQFKNTTYGIGLFVVEAKIIGAAWSWNI